MKRGRRVLSRNRILVLWVVAALAMLVLASAPAGATTAGWMPLLPPANPDRVGHGLGGANPRPLQVDEAPPLTTANLTGTLGLAGWFVSPVLVILTATDNVRVMSTHYRIGNETWRLYTEPFSIEIDGRHTLDFFSIDNASNLEDPKTTPVPIDRSPPRFLSLSPRGILHSASVRLAWEAEDDASGIAGYEVSVDGGAFQSVGDNTSLGVSLADGGHAVRIRALDAAGNTGEATYDFRVDTFALSLTGPQGTLLLLVVFGINVVIVLAIYARIRWKRPQRPRA